MAKSILLVEPDSQVAKLIKDSIQKILSDDEVAVFHASNAQDAIDLADKHRPDLVILEIGLPDQNGIAFLHEFRSYGEWLDVPVIINSFMDTKDHELAKSWDLLGVIQCLYKPTTSLTKLNSVVKAQIEPI